VLVTCVRHREVNRALLLSQLATPQPAMIRTCYNASCCQMRHSSTHTLSTASVKVMLDAQHSWQSSA
jgi:hypothetical protein